MESVLREQEGVIRADATFWKNQAVVEYDPERISPQELIEAVNNSSPYRAARLEGSYHYVSLLIEGGDGFKALNEVAGALYALPGVKVSALDPFKMQVYLEYQTERVSLKKIVETVASKTGYRLRVDSGEAQDRAEEAATIEERRKMFEKLWHRLLKRGGP